MNKAISTPKTVQQMFSLAKQIGCKASVLIGALDEAHGSAWIENEAISFPAPGSVPPGFTMMDAGFGVQKEEIAFYEGKQRDGKRWAIRSEWSSQSGEFSLSFWASDDNSMTVSETRDYANALLEMAAYIDRMKALMDAGMAVAK